MDDCQGITNEDDDLPIFDDEVEIYPKDGDIFIDADGVERVVGSEDYEEDEENQGDMGEQGSSEELPNGFTRQDYYDVGLSDTDIELWGLDQPGAPNPDMAGFAISDLQDGSIDGELGLSF